MYHHAEIWMSAQMPCVKCRCDDGQIRCTGEPHHCPPLCLPGQHTMPPGPCCETACRGKALQNLTATFANCSQPQTGVMHSHGDFIHLTGTCVDQKCLCVNGRWTCLDYCTPLAELSCLEKEAVIWDPFCCPRCPGHLECHVLLNAPYDTNGNFKTDEQQSTSIPIYRNEPLPSIVKQHSFSDVANTDQTDKNLLTEVTVPPGNEVALPQGHCYCLNSSILCPRPGRHIWHDEDCYYVDNHEGTYYAPNAHWIPQGDACTECQCLTNRTYVCRPRTCTNLFLCPPDKQPIIVPGECCPSFCGTPKNMSEPHNTGMKAPSWSIESEERPSSIGLFQEQNDARVNPLKVPNNEQLYVEEQKQLSGCPSFGGIEEQTPKATVFPPGSSLMLTRPCRNLLCVCTRDSRWMCTDHCPSCSRTLDSIETLTSFGRPPPAGKCCPPCDDNFGKPSGSWHLTGAKGMEPRQREIQTPWDDATQSSQFERLKPLADWSENVFSHYGTSGRYANDVKLHGTGNINSADREIKEEQIQHTLRMNIIIASLILFGILGIPMGTFIMWYLVKRRRRKFRRQAQRVKFHRRKSPYPVSTAGLKRPVCFIPGGPRHMANTSSTVSPNTSPSQRPGPAYNHQLTGVENREYDQTASGDDSHIDNERHNVRNVNQWLDETEMIDPKMRCWISTARVAAPIEMAHETKSVPPSPVFSKFKYTQPRREKPVVKSSESHTHRHKQSSRTSEGEGQTTVKSYANETTPMLPAELELKQKSSLVRRTASSLSASNGMPKSTTLTRASTWLVGAKNSNQILRRLISTTNRRSTGQRHSDNVAGIKLGKFARGTCTYSTDEEDLVRKPRSATLTGRSNKDRRHSNGSPPPSPATNDEKTNQRTKSEVRLKVSRPTTLVEPYEVSYRARESTIHHFLPVVQPRMAFLKQRVSCPPSECNTSRSPETDNTSITDSQTLISVREQQRTPIEEVSFTPEQNYESMKERVAEENAENPDEMFTSRVLPSEDMCYTWPRLKENEAEQRRNGHRHHRLPENRSATMTSPENERHLIPVDK